MAAGTYQRLATEGESSKLPEKEGDAESQNGASRPSLRRPLRVYASLIVASVIGAVMLFAGIGISGSGSHAERLSPLSLAELRSGEYYQKVQQIAWLDDGVDGEYLRFDGHDWVVAKWPNRDNRRIVGSTVKIAEKDTRVDSVSLNTDRQWAAISTNKTKNWRHSSFASYSLVDTKSGTLTPVHNHSALSIVKWSPRGDSLAYVADRNLWLHDLSSGKETQLTFDGGTEVFNGIPDWVYEEEVFTGDTALWWSQSGNHVAYLRTNDSLVPRFPIPYFVRGPGERVSAYPEVLELKYPKPGFSNPLVELWIASSEDGSLVKAEIATELEEIIITEVVWAGEHVIVKIMDRESDHQEVWVSGVDGSAELVRSDPAGSGWFEVTHNTRFVPATDNRAEGYIDTIDLDGWNHLAWFSPINASQGVALTRGEWEVEDAPYSISLTDGAVYFSATKKLPTQRSLHRVFLSAPGEIEDLTAEEVGVFSAAWSGDSSYALITHRHPERPLVQRIETLENTTVALTRGKVIEENRHLVELLANRTLGQVIYGQIEVAPNVSVNYREIRPSNFDENSKHPLLFYNYGGPGSQMVQESLSIDFQRVFAESHDAVVLTVDPRGTGFMGREFRACVRDTLGILEAHDVIEVARQWNEKPYIDETTTAIWGWSYGGFLTLKTLEQDVRGVFQYGVAVAPVTDWALYDSVYTERYMHTPMHNSKGYEAAAIRNVTTLSRHSRFLVMHGTGDDNVHFQNTLSLLDHLDEAGVENYDIHVFPDSDHSINFHNANPIVYDKIDNWLHEHQSKR